MSQAALRQRRHRARRREGVRVYPVEVYADTIEALIREGWTDAREAADPVALASVFTDIIHCAAHKTLPGLPDKKSG